MPIDAVSVLCAQLTRDLLAIAKFLLNLTTLYIRPLPGGAKVMPFCLIADVCKTTRLIFVVFWRIPGAFFSNMYLIIIFIGYETGKWPANFLQTVIIL